MRNALLLPVLLLPAVLHAQAPPITLISPNPESQGQFGLSVSGVPDADGDGKADLLVGAQREDGGAPTAGRAYLYSGATGALLRTLQSPNPQVDGSFGGSVSGVADANGDGRGDLLVGALLENGGAPLAGRAYLFSGATGALLRTLQSPNPILTGFFGGSVSGVADVNGDGRGDLLVGARGEFGGAFESGRAYLYSGATGALLRTLELPSPVVGAFLGTSVSGVPDVNDDGLSDLLVGAVGENGGAQRAGRAHLFSGATGALLRSLRSPNPEALGRFGGSVSGVPDADGDGKGDLLAGADAEDGGAPDVGRAYLFSGATGQLLHTLESLFFNTNGPDFFGASVAGVADADDDGRGDLLIGAPGEDRRVGLVDFAVAGRAYLFSGATGDFLRSFESPAPDTSAYFGISVSEVADTDSDGKGEFLIGAYGENGGANAAGRTYFFRSGRGIALAVSGTPTTIPPGGTVTVTATVSNTTSQPASLDLWVVATRNGNPRLTRLIGSGTLPAGATVTRAFSLTAPGNTPQGPYTVVVNVGDFPDTVLASDAFDVTVTSAPRVSDTPSAVPFVVAPLSGDLFAAGAPASLPSSVVVSPNPFAGQTALRFTLAEASPVRLSVHDVLGREVALLTEGPREAGPHTVTLDASALPAGVYVYRLVVGRQVATGRLTVVE